jgi:hypothetical protein
MAVAVAIAIAMAMCLLAACASNQLASTPPAGVDLSGEWKLNEADSDDTQRLMQSQLKAATANAGAGGQTGSGGGGTGGSGGRRGGRGGAGGFGPAGPAGPTMPSVAALDEALSWPGKNLTLQQAQGTVAFTSGANVRSCRMGEGKGRRRPPPPPANGAPRNRDAPSHGRGDAPPPRCGWDESTLVVRSGEPDEDRARFELRFSLSADGERLEEVVVFQGGRSTGFVASREWDRVPPPGAPAAAAR